MGYWVSYSSEVTQRPLATAVTWHWDLVYAVFTWSGRYPLNTEVSRLNKVLNGRSKQEVGASSHSILNKLSCGPVDLAIYSGLLSAQPFPQNCSTQTLDCIHLVHVSTDILSTVESCVIWHTIDPPKFTHKVTHTRVPVYATIHKVPLYKLSQCLKRSQFGWKMGILCSLINSWKPKHVCMD